MRAAACDVGGVRRAACRGTDARRGGSCGVRVRRLEPKLLAALFLIYCARADIGSIPGLRSEDELADQLLTAAASVSAQYWRELRPLGVADQLKFLGYALRSVRECMSWYEGSRDRLPPALMMTANRSSREFVGSCQGTFALSGAGVVATEESVWRQLKQFALAVTPPNPAPRTTPHAARLSRRTPHAARRTPPTSLRSVPEICN